MLLTEDEYARSTKRKRAAGEEGEQFSDQPDDVARKVSAIKVSAIKDGGPTKAMLDDRARELEIDGRSSMTKDELLDAIEQATDENGRRRGGRASLSARTRDELYDLAKERDIDGRSDMTKDELIDALADD